MKKGYTEMKKGYTEMKKGYTATKKGLHWDNRMFFFRPIYVIFFYVLLHTHTQYSPKRDRIVNELKYFY